MSITHILKFESNRSQDEILSILLSSEMGIYPAKYDQLKAEGLFGGVNENSKVSQQNFYEDYGFKPNLRISFDEDSDGDIEKGEKTMGKAVALILQQEKGDAIFFYVVDTPILKRINGRLQVAEEKWYQWLRDALDETNLVYETKPTEQIWEN